jgi:hypothetical protein
MHGEEKINLARLRILRLSKNFLHRKVKIYNLRENTWVTKIIFLVQICLNYSRMALYHTSNLCAGLYIHLHSHGLPFPARAPLTPPRALPKVY